MAKQISVFLENKTGRLAKVTKLLGKNNINIRALSIADTTDFGILRLIVDKPDDAYRVIKESGMAVSETEVIAVEIPDIPGGLAAVISVIEEAGINIEYLYAFLERSALDAVVLFRVEDGDVAVQALTANGMKIVSDDLIYNL